MVIESQEELKEKVWDIVHSTPVLDIHTHIYDARFADLLLWGIDELLTYHYLVAEFFRYEPMDYEEFFALDKREQANLVWQKVFIENSPVSESARGLLTTLGMLGLDPSTRDLEAYRKFFASRTTEQHISDVFSRTNLSAVIMTNDPFDDLEAPVWMEGEVSEKDEDSCEEAEDGQCCNDRSRCCPPVGERDPRFLAALRIDTLLLHWKKTASKKLKQAGYKVKGSLDKNVYPEITRFLNDWIDRIDPIYMAASLPPDFDFYKKSECSKILEKCVLPVCRERDIPMAMMIGVNKLVNPDLKLAGDGVGKADHRVVEKMCIDYPDNKFLVTMLSRENQHELCVTARKCPNLMIFGCWWFLNDPMTIDEMTRMRMELLGMSFTPQHSDARVLDQVLYKWAHSRWLIAHVLQEKYADLMRTGWTITEKEIKRDVENLFGNNFRRFVGREI